MNNKIIHVVCSQHYDIVWRREVQHYIDLRAKLYRNILNQLVLHNEMKWTFSQAYTLREFLEANSEYTSLVKELLKSGRLEIIGGQESISDLNMSSGTAIVHNIETGLSWFRDFLGYEVKAGAFEDAFGLPVQTPQILKLAGYEFFKADRMPHNGLPNISGDFNWIAPDGTSIKCVSTFEGNGDWGWGYPDNPDDNTPCSMEQRSDKVLARLKNAVPNESENILYTMVGEEHDLVDDLPRILRLASEATGNSYIFSTYLDYFLSLDEKYWRNRPSYDSSTDFSRLFTGCYTSRKKSKALPAKLESQLVKTEFNASFGKKDNYNELCDSWRKLFVMQFHDAICGCHIDENAAWLQQLYNEAIKKTNDKTALLPFKKQLPEMVEDRFEQDITAEVYTFGDWSFEFSKGYFEKVKYKGETQGRICSIMLREDSGTLWTEDYSGKAYEFPAPYKIEQLRQGADTIALTMVLSQSDFKEMWTGFACLECRLEMIFHKRSPFIQVKLNTNLLGNSTEIALRWHNPPSKTCLCGTAFGDVEHKEYDLAPMSFCGDAFPVANWAIAGNYVVFNTDSPGHALRNGQLETIVLRSPVRRWSPFFPVTPTHDCHDNGDYEFSFIVNIQGNMLSPSQLHKAALEFRMGNSKQLIKKPFDVLPENLVISSMKPCKNNTNEAIVFEADGIIASWDLGSHTERFNPNQIKRVAINV